MPQYVEPILVTRRLKVGLANPMVSHDAFEIVFKVGFILGVSHLRQIVKTELLIVVSRLVHSVVRGQINLSQVYASES